MEETSNMAANSFGAENVTASGTEEYTSGVDSATTESNQVDQAQETGENLPNTESNENLEGKAQAIPYGRFQEVNAERQALKAKVEELEQYRTLYQTLQERPEIASKFFNAAPQEAVDPRIQQAEQVLSKLGFTKTQDVETMVAQKLDQELVAREFRDTMFGLEKKVDGSDGRPKFVGQEVAKYMDQTGITDPEVAYEVMNKDSLAEWRAGKSKQKTAGTYSERPGQSMQTAGSDSYNELLNKARTGDESAIDKILGAHASRIFSK